MYRLTSKKYNDRITLTPLAKCKQCFFLPSFRKNILQNIQSLNLVILFLSIFTLELFLKPHFFESFFLFPSFTPFIPNVLKG
mmetsp:Transcript_3928/g.6047  ORF Transcript_3928/g.6047 Transcript_3928/m.6047 type:complete len:82 (-) Transcript_3928:634-879(-)